MKYFQMPPFIIIKGPITNIFLNFTEVARSFSCSLSLTYNISKARLDFILLPYRRTLKDAHTFIPQIQSGFNRLKYVTEPIHHEVMDDDPPIEDIPFVLNQTNPKGYAYTYDAERFFITQSSTRRNPFRKPGSPYRYGKLRKRYRNTVRRNSNNLTAEEVQRKYTQKVKRRCEMQIKRGEMNCLKAFQNAFENCENKLPPVVEKLICWPFKLSFVCSIGMIGQLLHICDPRDIIPDSFGATYIELLKTEEKIFETPGSTKYNYTLIDRDNLEDML